MCVIFTFIRTLYLVSMNRVYTDRPQNTKFDSVLYRKHDVPSSFFIRVIYSAIQIQMRLVYSFSHVLHSFSAIDVYSI